MPGPSSATSTRGAAGSATTVTDDRVRGVLDARSRPGWRRPGPAGRGRPVRQHRAGRVGASSRRRPASSISRRKPSTESPISSPRSTEAELQRELAALELGQVEQVAHQPFESPGLGQDDARRLPGVGRGAVGDGLGVAPDRGQRRAQVVRHRQQELALEPARPFERVGHLVDRPGQGVELVGRAGVVLGHAHRQVAVGDAGAWPAVASVSGWVRRRLRRAAMSAPSSRVATDARMNQPTPLPIVGEVSRVRNMTAARLVAWRGRAGSAAWPPTPGGPLSRCTISPLRSAV